MNRIKTILGRAFPLALGLALSIVMIARICFDLSYDKFYEDADRIYRIRTTSVLQGTVRTMVLTICEKLGIPVSLDAPRLSEIGQWDACFITSTSRFVMNINTIRVWMQVEVNRRRMERFFESLRKKAMS